MRLFRVQASAIMRMSATAPLRNIRPPHRVSDAAVQSVKKLPKRLRFWYNRGDGGVFMQDWRKDARREPIIVDLEALVPENHLLRKIERVMDYE